MDEVHDAAPEDAVPRRPRTKAKAKAVAPPFEVVTLIEDAIPLPPGDLLAHSTPTAGPDEEAEAGTATLTALFERFRIDAQHTGHSRGPVAICHRIQPGPGSSAAQLVQFGPDIEYALPGARMLSASGAGHLAVAVPTRLRARVLLGDLLKTVPADTPDELTAILGVGFTGRPVTINIPDLPHLLMAGTTGSGKSTCLHAIITSILTRVQPEQAQMILIDTRSLELARYDRVAHLVTRVATTGEKAAQALTWAAREAQARLDTFADVGKRNIEDFNTAVRAGHIRAPLSDDRQPRLYPRLLIAIDDLADLLRSPQRREVQDSLFQIGTRGRITGVHLIAGTRHPQAFALPPRVAATMPARLSFAATESASPTRDLTVGTAELRVLGSDPVRVWCPDMTEREIDAVARHWRHAAEAALRRLAQP